MSTLLYVVGGIVLVIALLVARGMYLLGRGSDVEYEAREKATSSGVSSTGFQLLDRLRYGKLPIVSQVEGLLGRGSEEESRARCRDCRNVWMSGQPTGQPTCPNCGGQDTRIVSSVASQ